MQSSFNSPHILNGPAYNFMAWLPPMEGQNGTTSHPLLCFNLICPQVYISESSIWMQIIIMSTVTFIFWISWQNIHYMATSCSKAVILFQPFNTLSWIRFQYLVYVLPPLIISPKELSQYTSIMWPLFNPSMPLTGIRLNYTNIVLVWL